MLLLELLSDGPSFCFLGRLALGALGAGEGLAWRASGAGWMVELVEGASLITDTGMGAGLRITEVVVLLPLPL